VAREVDVDVVRRVVAAVPGQLHALAADLQRVAVGERLLRCRLGRVAVPQQQPAAFLVPDADHIAPEDRGAAGVVGVMVRVDDVRHRAAHALGRGDLVHGPLQVVAEGRRRVEQNHAIPGRQECRVVVAVGDPVQVPLHAPDVVAPLVQGRAEGGARDRHVIRQDRRCHVVLLRNARPTVATVTVSRQSLDSGDRGDLTLAGTSSATAPRRPSAGRTPE
jgi:hypothetical protein